MNTQLFSSATQFFDTDSDGRFAFRVGPGNFELTHRASQVRKPRPSTSRWARRKKSRGTSGFRICCVDCETIRGVVRALRSDGPAIAGEGVFAESKRARIPNGVTDAQGRFELYRPFGKGVLYA